MLVSASELTSRMSEELSLEARFDEVREKSFQSGEWEYFGSYEDYIAVGYFEGFQRALVLISDEDVFVKFPDVPHQKLAYLFNSEIGNSLNRGFGDKYYRLYFSQANISVNYWRIWNCGQKQQKYPDFCVEQHYYTRDDATSQNRSVRRMLIAGEVGDGHKRSLAEVIREAAQYLSRYTHVTYVIGIFFEGNHENNLFHFEYFVMGRTHDNQYDPEAIEEKNYCRGNFKPAHFFYEPGRERFFADHGVQFLVPPTLHTGAFLALLKL